MANQSVGSPRCCARARAGHRRQRDRVVQPPRSLHARANSSRISHRFNDATGSSCRHLCAGRSASRASAAVPVAGAEPWPPRGDAVGRARGSGPLVKSLGGKSRRFFRPSAWPPRLHKPIGRRRCGRASTGDSPGARRGRRNGWGERASLSAHRPAAECAGRDGGKRMRRWRR